MVSMVVEDEYTVNVRLRRPVGSHCPAPPKVTVLCEESNSKVKAPPERTALDKHSSLTGNDGSSGKSNELQVVRRSPRFSPSRLINNGIAEGGHALGFTELQPRNLRRVRHTYDPEDIKKASCQNMRLSLPPAQDEPPTSRGAQICVTLQPNGRTVTAVPQIRNGGIQQSLSMGGTVEQDYGADMEEGGVMRGWLQLPVVQVFADDNSLVAKNHFTKPDNMKQAEEKRYGSGDLFIPRIKSHCLSQNGELFVPEVDVKNLRSANSALDAAPTPGNSRRAKFRRQNMQRREEAAPVLLRPQNSRTLHNKNNRNGIVFDVDPEEYDGPNTSVLKEKERKAWAAKKEEARALLGEVLIGYMTPQSPTYVINGPLYSKIPLRNQQQRIHRRHHNLSGHHIISPHDHLHQHQGQHHALPLQTEFPQQGRLLHGRNQHSKNYQCKLNDPLRHRSRVHFADADENVNRHQHEEGERVVETYGGPPSTAGGQDELDNRSQVHLQAVVDPANLTQLDLEADHLDNYATPVMLVANSSPAPLHNCSHDHNHNARNKAGNHDSLRGRAAKYLVDSPTPQLGGHDNFAYDESYCQGHDNFCYDPGYSSEKSPDEEEVPQVYERLQSSSESGSNAETPVSPVQLPEGVTLTLEHLKQVCPFINDETLFEVTVVKNSRGLGLAVMGGVECNAPWAGLIRIKKLYPQTPAWLCGQLQVEDILLEANGITLTGLTSHEALEMLRATDKEVVLKICRPPPGSLGEASHLQSSSQHDPPVITTSLTAPHSSHNHLSPSPSFSGCGEFEIALTKVAGSLGFTLHKRDNSILGHTIRSLVKEPAVSDGRIKPGDKILSVNGTDMCGLSHEEAVAFLRTCPDTVALRLYRDAMQTPVSPASPTEPDGHAKPKPLRKEARDMLTDLASRKHSSSSTSPNVISGSIRSPGTARRRRLQKTPSPNMKAVVADRWESLVRHSEQTSAQYSPPFDSRQLDQRANNVHEASPLDLSQADSTDSTITSSSREVAVHSRNNSASSCHTNSSNSDSSKPRRPNFLDLSGRQSCPRKTQFTPPHELDQSFQSPSVDSLDSVPQLTSAHSDTPAFAHQQQGYQSVNLGSVHSHHERLTNTASDHNLSSHITSSPPDKKCGLLKWKGVVFTPDEEDGMGEESGSEVTISNSESSAKLQKPKIVTLEMNKGWMSRLGFSLQQQGEGTFIIAIYADSVAAKDGRLRIGDQLLKVGGLDVSKWKTEDVIDLLRKTRGKVNITVLQKPLS